MHKKWLIGLGLSVMLFGSTAFATEHQHEMESTHRHESMGAAEQMFLVKKEVDGYTVTFHVMPAGGMYHGGSHNLMIRVEQDGKDAEIKAINSKVFYPNGATESKMLIKMGEWYMNGFDLHGHKKHGFMILFKTADGQKHKASVYYPDEK